MGRHIWCFDGVCGICNASVQFFLKHDRRGAIRFTHLQGSFAQRELRARGVDPAELDAGLQDSANFRSFYLIADYGTPAERVYRQSRGMRRALISLGGFWGFLGTLGWWTPDWMWDWAYAIFSRVRYRVGKKHEACIVPTPELRMRFIEE